MSFRGSGEAPRRVASGLRHDAARIDRLDAAEVGLGQPRAARSARSWIDCQPAFETRALPRRLRLAGQEIPLQAGLADRCRSSSRRPSVRCDAMPELPDHWERHRGCGRRASVPAATSPARNFLNSTFNETPTSLAREVRPTVMIHPDDAAPLGIADGDEGRARQRARRGAAACASCSTACGAAC